MKLRSFAVAALAAMTLAACSKDGNNDGPDGPDVAEGETYATLNISLTNANTRAFYGNLAPTADEKKLHDLTIYIYDENTSKMEVRETFTSGVTQKTIKLNAGPKKIFATSGIDPNDVFSATATNIDVNKIISIADETAFGDLIVNGEFWMTSQVIEKTLLSASEDEAKTPGHTNNLTLYMGRAMAKIGVYHDESANGAVKDAQNNNLGTITDMKYIVRNQPNAMHLFTTADANGVWKTPYYNRNGNVWKDEHKADYWDQTVYVETKLDAAGKYHATPSYMMENSNITARYGNATYLTLRGKFTPNLWKKDDGTAGSASSDGTFWRIANVTFDTDGTTVLSIDSWENDFFNDVPTGTAIDDANQIAVKYDKGLTYYKLYLDSSLVPGYTGPTEDRYSQRRNQYWSVEITSITNVGWNDEDGGGGEDPEPLDKAAWIQATIEVLDWVPVEMPGDLEGAQ